MISGKRKCKEIERKSFGAKMKQKQSKNRVKIEQKQGSARLRSLRESSAKLALRCETISQLNWLLCENFRNCETKFGTRVPLRSTEAPISKLQIGCEALKLHFVGYFAAAKPILAHKCHFVAQWPPFQSCEMGYENSFFLRNPPFCCKIGLLQRNSKWPLIFHYFL